MKRKLLPVSAIAVAFIVLGLVSPQPSAAGVSVNISVPLPHLVIPAPPGLIVVPGTYVYYPPDVDADIFFYQGYWYRPYRGGWYIAGDYNGPWRSTRRVPPPILNVPPGHRHMTPVHERVPYGQVKKNWRSWENERRWDNARNERGERGDRGGHERGHGRGHGKHRD